MQGAIRRVPLTTLLTAGVPPPLRRPPLPPRTPAHLAHPLPPHPRVPPAAHPGAQRPQHRPHPPATPPKTPAAAGPPHPQTAGEVPQKRTPPLDSSAKANANAADNADNTAANSDTASLSAK